MNAILNTPCMAIIVGYLEMAFFFIGAVTLGYTLHYFIFSRKMMDVPEKTPPERISENDDWKLKYYHDMEEKEKLLQQAEEELFDSRGNEKIAAIEIEELKKEMQQLVEKHAAEAEQKPIDPVFYLAQLKTTEESLLQHNDRINHLLEQVELMKQTEMKYLEMLRSNEQLNVQLRDLRRQFADKESELNKYRQQQLMTRELQDRLEKAYTEYAALQDKLQKVEGYLINPHNRVMDFEELQESYFKNTKEFDELKLRHMKMEEGSQHLQRLLADAEYKLRESNFQRQQLLKKVAFMEELNSDLQQVSEHNKKMEGQLRRLGEIENLLSRISLTGEDPSLNKPQGS
jgi:Tfp pilus assembly protein PilO